jgi:hypothetical protein
MLLADVALNRSKAEKKPGRTCAVAAAARGGVVWVRLEAPPGEKRTKP